MEYDLEVSDGDELGLYLEKASTDSGTSAAVHSTVAGSKAAQISSPGDVVISINSTQTAGLSFNQTLATLKNALRPITIRLFRPLPLEEAGNSMSEIVVCLQAGPLGIFFTEDDASNHFSCACVMEVSNNSKATDVRPGDSLSSINGQGVQTMQFQDIMYSLRHIDYPVRLSLHRNTPTYLSTPAMKSSSTANYFTEISITLADSLRAEKHTLGLC